MLVGAGLILLAIALFALWPPARSGITLTLLIAATGFVLLVVGRLRARGERKAGTVVAVVSVLLIALVILAPLVSNLIRTAIQSTHEQLTIFLASEDGGSFSVWLPVLLGSPYDDPAAVLHAGSTIILVQTPDGTFLNVTATGTAEIHGFGSSSGFLDESYLEYRWSTAVLMSDGFRTMSRAFASGNVTVLVRFTAVSDYCQREDTLGGTVPGDGTWGTLVGFSQASCS